MLNTNTCKFVLGPRYPPEDSRGSTTPRLQNRLRICNFKPLFTRRFFHLTWTSTHT